MKNLDGINPKSKPQNPHLYIIVHLLGGEKKDGPVRKDEV